MTRTLTESVIRVKKAGLKSPMLMSSEAEALRKDPLKNYQEHERELPFVSPSGVMIYEIKRM